MNVPQDLRYALRGLQRSPFFTCVALLTLAITSGATTAVFSVVDGVLLKPLPYPESQDLVALSHTAPGANLPSGDDRLPLSAAMYFTYLEENRTFQSLGVWTRQTRAASENTAQEIGVLKEDGVLWTLWLRIGAAHGKALSVKLAAEGRSRKANFWMLWSEEKFKGNDARILLTFTRAFSSGAARECESVKAPVAAA
jgi:hypothetical protein